MKILAVIPARGGSKGIRRKNLRLLNNKPLIYYQIKNAIESKYITDIVITSEDDEILNYVSKFPVSLRKRPEELSGDSITLDPVIYDAVNYMEKERQKYDIVITLQPTSPLLKTETLDNAIKKFIEENNDTTIPVVDATHLCWIEKDNSIIPEYKERLNRQWLPKKYKETGAFLITKREFVKENSRFGDNVKIFVMNEYEGIDIDTPLDWLIAESLMKRLNIVFAVNGNKNIGMGHMYRAITLADKLMGHDVLFLTWDSDTSAINLIEDMGHKVIKIDNDELLSKISEIKPDIVINDILDTDSKYIESLKEHAAFVVNFEDLGDGADEAYLVFNALYEMTNPKPNRRFGYEYVCLNERFYLCDSIMFNNAPKVMFVSFGGVDQNNLTCKTLKLVPKIIDSAPIEKIIVVIGPAYAHKDELNSLINNLKDYNIELYENVKNMPKLMGKSDLAITSNGRTVYELTSIGIPTISIAQNDRETLHLFSRYHKGIRYLGIACNVDDDKLLNTIEEIANNDDIRKKMYDEQIKASKVIKNGVDKIVNEILSEYREWKYEND